MMTTRTLLTSALFVAAVLGSSGCGDKKMRDRIAALDTATLTEIQEDYPADSKPGRLVREELQRRGPQTKPASSSPPASVSSSRMPGRNGRSNASDRDSARQAPERKADKAERAEPEKQPTERREIFGFSPFTRDADLEMAKKEGMETALTSSGSGGLTIFGTAFTVTGEDVPVPSSRWVIVRANVVGSGGTLTASINEHQVWRHSISDSEVVESPPISLAKHGVNGDTFRVSLSVSSFPPTGGVQWLSVCEGAAPK